MTQNDISYYSARNERRDARLRRKEAKRHNVASEATERTKAAASLMSAQAAQTNAATNVKQYQLGWEQQYGMEYGTDPEDHTWVLWDLSTGEKRTDSRNWDPASRRKWLEDRSGDNIIYYVGDNKYGIPNAYIKGLVDIERGIEEVRVQESQATKNFWDTIKSAGSTANVVVETGSNLLFGMNERNKKGGR